jgi:hypothetical protein
MATNGTIIQYKFVNNGFSNFLYNVPSLDSPYPGLPTLYCYDGGLNGYKLNISPHSSNNQINVQFKVKYAISDVTSTAVTIGVVYTINGGLSYGLVGKDTFTGSVNAGGPIYDVYMFNYMHSPNTTNNVEYKMFFQIQNVSEIQLGLIGDATSSNCIILDEFTLK